MTLELSAKPVYHQVRCTECGRIAVGPALGWEAYLSGGYENEPVEVVVFCPGCALRESDFSPSRLRPLLSHPGGAEPAQELSPQELSG